MLKRNAHFVLLTLALAVTSLAYQQGLYGYFIFDDWSNILENPRLAIKDLHPETLMRAAFSGHSGPLMRPVSMLSFALNHYMNGFDPFIFKLTNLIIHLLNGIGLFLLSNLLLQFYRRQYQPALTEHHVRWLSAVVASVWLLHPLNLTSVLYAVQRMTSLAAFFTIWGLACFTWGRTRMADGRNGIPAILASVLLFLPLSALSKENGILLPLFIAIIEFTLFRLQAQQASARRFILAFYTIFVLLPGIGGLYYFATRYHLLMDAYVLRDFTLPERLMTQARVLWFYMGQILAPAVSKMGLFHDDIEISRGLLAPDMTLPAILGLLTLLALATAAIRKAPLVAFGLFFFFGGHLMESTVLPLEIAHEHRNYLPMFGILLATLYYFLYPLHFLDSLRMRHVAALLLIGLFALNTYTRARNWSNPVQQFEAEAAYHPNSPRANNSVADLYSKIQAADPAAGEMYYLQAMFHYQKAAALAPDNAHSLFGMIRLQATQNKPIDPSWVADLARRLEQPPFPFADGAQLAELFECQADGACNIPKEHLHTLVQAALRSPGLTPATRANAYAALHLYRLHLENDLPGAIQALEQTIAAMPYEPEYRVNLINFLLMKEHYQQARENLEKFRQMAQNERYTKVIDHIDKLLSSKSF